MRTDRCRYTEWRVQNSNILVERELYDQFLDPDEDTNVVDHAEYAVDVATLAAQSQARLDELSPDSGALGDNLITNGPVDDPELNVNISEGTASGLEIADVSAERGDCRPALHDLHQLARVGC